MKDSAVLKRSMFSEKLPKSVRNSGIMAGFEDDDMLEGPEKEDEMPVMARTPQNPEILMNNLRGDMRSVDARYQELAQMVGEEAAMETPPEVLAMLQMQFGQQQGGIGALPQGAGMMPPPMDGGAPMGGPGGAPAMPPPMPTGMPPQGAMPPGMESAGPFPQGGADQAPPTPDGMPPINAAVGAFITPATRAAQFISDKAAVYGPRVNQYLGNLMMAPQPTIQRLTGGDPAMNLTRQAGESLIRNPATGEILQAAGSKLAPYTTMGPLTSPTLTQGIAQGLNRLAVDYPRVAALLPPSVLAAVGVTGPNLTAEQRSTPLSPEEQEKYDFAISQLNAIYAPASQPVLPTVAQPASPPLVAKPVVAKPVVAEPEAAAVDPDPLGSFINEKLKLFDEREAKGKPLSRINRIKAAQEEYGPLYKELLGDTAEDTKTNALLLLADAGFKLASTYKPTFAMAVAESAKDLPRGFAAIVAQAKDRDIKVKTAALTQAISDVQEQDKYAQALKIQLLKGDYDLLKERAKQGGMVIEDAGLGGRVTKTKNGSFIGFGIESKDPAVTSAIQSRFTLRDTDNPFVENRGQAPTSIETNKEERIKLGNTLRSLDNSLSTLDNLKGVYTNAYGPGTWFLDKVNNLLVPIDPTGLVKPNFDTADAATRISTGMNSLLKNIASANDGGRVAVQEQEWVRETAKGISNPTAFFSDKELAAKQFGSTEAMLRNARQQVLTQLGYESNDYVMNTPNTGTKNDPFRIPTDPAEQGKMFTFLGSTVGKLQDPKAVVYLNMGPLGIKPFTPAELRQKAGLQ